MELETRVENLENLMNSLIEMINNGKFYTNADISGVRKNINETSEIANKADKATSLTGITVDEVMTEIIPSLAEKDESLTSTLDSILTDIIPSLMSE